MKSPFDFLTRMKMRGLCHLYAGCTCSQEWGRAGGLVCCAGPAENAPPMFQPAFSHMCRCGLPDLMSLTFLRRCEGMIITADH